MLGYVTAEQLAALYAGASMLAFPSRFEGFGIPVVEAMAPGVRWSRPTQRRCRHWSVTRACCVDPDDVPGWARAMNELLADAAARQRLSDAGRARAAELAAVDPVQLLVDVYAKVGS